MKVFNPDVDYHVVDASPHRILLEETEGGMQLNEFILITANRDDDRAWLEINQLKIK